MAIKIPKYVEDILARSQWKAPYYMVGMYREGFYTFTILKKTRYTTLRVFRREVDRFLAWANREARRKYGCIWPVAHVVNAPRVSRHHMQYIVVKIVDPIMHDIEDKIVNDLQLS